MTSDEKTRRVEIVSDVLASNDRIARENRRRFSAAGLLVIDVMGSPGSGKTSLLEGTFPLLPEGVRAAVISGDISTARDAWRLTLRGIPAVQIMTESMGGACHLEAGMLSEALDRLDLDDLDLLFIENVGNLVCPAEFDLGQDARVVVLSVTEGEDKPLKYPLAFSQADLVVVSKMDLVPHLRVDMDALDGNIREVNAGIQRLKLSAWTGMGMEAWIEWLEILGS